MGKGEVKMLVRFVIEAHFRHVSDKYSKAARRVDFPIIVSSITPCYPPHLMFLCAARVAPAD